MLEVTGLHVAYGGIQAVRSITFHVNQGETVALIGANGAGKTSTLKAISRIINMAGGDVHFCGEKIGRIPSHELIRQGIALVPEGRGVFPRLTVAENLAMGAFIRDDKAEIQADMERMYAYFPRLKERSFQLAGTLSGGEQQMLALGRALMTNPHLVILDEATEGLAPLIAREIWRICDVIRASGISSVIVDKNWKHVTQVTDRNVILVKGEVVFEGTSAQITAQPELLTQHLGV